MKTKQFLKVENLNQKQLISFLSQVLNLGDFGFKHPLETNKIQALLSNPAFEEWPLSERFPNEYLFIGEVYFDSEESAEETEVLFQEMNLPILGNCKVFHDLRRIVYWDMNWYAEDYDVLPNPHPENKRLSFESYAKMLEAYSEKINAARKIVA